MKKTTFEGVLAILKRLPSTVVMDRESEGMYARALAAIPDNVIRKVMDRVVRECELRPSPAVIIRMVEEEREMVPAHYVSPKTYRQDRSLPGTGEGPCRQSAREIIANLKRGKASG